MGKNTIKNNYNYECIFDHENIGSLRVEVDSAKKNLYYITLAGFTIDIVLVGVLYSSNPSILPIGLVYLLFGGTFVVGGVKYSVDDNDSEIKLDYSKASWYYGKGQSCKTEKKVWYIMHNFSIKNTNYQNKVEQCKLEFKINESNFIKEKFVQGNLTEQGLSEKEIDSIITTLPKPTEYYYDTWDIYEFKRKFSFEELKTICTIKLIFEFKENFTLNKNK